MEPDHKTSPPSDGWHASMALGFARRGGRTSLVTRTHRGPLTVQRPLYPEGGVCHVYVLHPPGGVVGGDCLDLCVHVHPSAAAVLTTPGATRLYRSAGPRAKLRQTMTVEPGASLEWLPQENILFPGANADLTTQVNLQADARFMGWEIHCLGRPALGEPFDRGHARLRFAVHRDGRPLLLESVRVAGAESLDTLTGLRAYPATGTFVATGADPELLERVRGAIYTLAATPCGAGLLDDLLVVRWLGVQAAEAKRLFVRAWQVLRPALLGREAVGPRVWAT